MKTRANIPAARNMSVGFSRILIVSWLYNAGGGGKVNGSSRFTSATTPNLLNSDQRLETPRILAAAQSLQRFHFNLANPLARQSEYCGDLLECVFAIAA